MKLKGLVSMNENLHRVLKNEQTTKYRKINFYFSFYEKKMTKIIILRKKPHTTYTEEKKCWKEKLKKEEKKTKTIE